MLSVLQAVWRPRPPRQPRAPSPEPVASISTDRPPARIEPDAEDMRRAREGRLARLRAHSFRTARESARRNSAIRKFYQHRSVRAVGPSESNCGSTASSILLSQSEASQPNHYVHDNGCPIWQPLRPLRGSSWTPTLITCAERSRWGFPVSSPTSFANSPKRTR